MERRLPAERRKSRWGSSIQEIQKAANEVRTAPAQESAASLARSSFARLTDLVDLLGPGLYFILNPRKFYFKISRPNPANFTEISGEIS